MFQDKMVYTNVLIVSSSNLPCLKFGVEDQQTEIPTDRWKLEAPSQKLKIGKLIATEMANAKYQNGMDLAKNKQ